MVKWEFGGGGGGWKVPLHLMVKWEFGGGGGVLEFFFFFRRIIL